MQPEDWPAIQVIYLEGIASGKSTFETSAPDWETWDRSHRQDCRLVAESVNGRVIGWAALSQISKRHVYHGVADVSIYVGETSRGNGIGRILLSLLVEESERVGIWTLQSGIFAENEASFRLHQACGFRLVGRRESIAQLNGVWHDTLLMERRSKIVGLD